MKNPLKTIKKYPYYYPKEAYQKAKKLRKYYKKKKMARLVTVTKGSDKTIVYVYGYRFNKPFSKDFDIIYPDQIEEIVATANFNVKISDKMKDERRVFLYTLAMSGRRISELLGRWGIRPKDIDPHRGIIKFMIHKKRIKKTQEMRIPVPVNSLLIQLLIDYLKNKDWPDDTPIFFRTRSWANKILNKVGEEKDIKLWPHLFRHSHAARLAESAQSPKAVTMIKSQMQHSSADQTYQYIERFNVKEEREMLDKNWSIKNTKPTKFQNNKID